jgi:sporulation protein YlmC with PRC-barrel domain
MANNPSGRDSTRDPNLGGRTNAGFGSSTGSQGVGGSTGSQAVGGGTTGSGSGGYTGSSSGGSSAGSMAGAGEGARIEGGGQYENTSGPGPRLMTASTLEGDRVVNRQGEDLGEIDEIMLDVPRGRIAYAVMSSGGFLGMGDKLFAIPWGALTLDTDNKCFVLDVDKQRLEGAPGFDKDNWPNAAQADFDERVHSYYGVRPYWE